MIKFFDYPSVNKPYLKEISKKINEVVDSGNFILGPRLEEFEKNFSSFFSAKFSVGVGNGLDALTISLKALGIKSGDEVLVPSHTFIATWQAVRNVGAIPIPVDIEEKTYNMDPSLLESSITSKTRAVIVVHLYGQPCNLEQIKKVAVKHNLRMIEDAAQAHGAKYKGNYIGSFSDVVCWSFYPTKNMGCFGDGGMITTNQKKIKDMALMIRNYGSKKKYIHSEDGINSRLDEIQAAILNVKLFKLEEEIIKRTKIANTYLKEIKNESISLPHIDKGVKHAWHLFVIRTKKRNELVTLLEKKGIQTLIHYPTPPFEQKMFKSKVNICPVAKKISKEILSLPLYPGMKMVDVKKVIKTINGFK